MFNEPTDMGDFILFFLRVRLILGYSQLDMGMLDSQHQTICELFEPHRQYLIEMTSLYFDVLKINDIVFIDILNVLTDGSIFHSPSAVCTITTQPTAVVME